MRPRSLKTMAAAAAPLLVLAAITMAAAPARAADATSGAVQSAYWWQGEMAGATVPAPPSVPSGGLWVSSNPSGTQAISALRFTLAPGQATAVVTLAVHQAQPASQVALSACPTTSNWSAGQGPGTWADRPVADCQSGQVPGQLNSGATTVTFNLTSLAAGSDVDAVIVPTPATAPAGGTTPVTAPAAVAPTFDITFEPFTASDVAATAVSQPATTPQTAPYTAPLPSYPSLYLPQEPLGLFPPALVPATAPTAPPTTPSAAQSPSIGPPTSATAPASVTRVIPRSWRDRLLLAFMFIDLVALAVLQGRKGTATGKPRLSLYDVPPIAVDRIALAVAESRVGAPPALR